MCAKLQCLKSITHQHSYQHAIYAASCFVYFISAFVGLVDRVSAQEPLPTGVPLTIIVQVQPEAGYASDVTAQVLNNPDLTVTQVSTTGQARVFELSLPTTTADQPLGQVLFDAPAHLACFVELSATSPGSTISLKAGDVNNDGVIDYQDISEISSSLASGELVGDINQDGRVDILDLTYVGGNYRTQTGTCSVIPMITGPAENALPNVTETDEPTVVEALPTSTPILLPTLDVTPTALPDILSGVEAESDVVSRIGEWTAHDTDIASGGCYLFSSGATGDALLLIFSGTTVDIVFVKHPALGTFGIEIDGTLEQTIVSTSDETIFGVRVRIDYLNPGPHALRVYAVEGTIALDAFAAEEVTALPSTLEPTMMVLPTIEPTTETLLESTATPLPSTLEPTMMVLSTIEPTTETLLEPTAIPLLPVFPLPVVENFDSGLNWTPAGSWALDDQAGTNGMSWFASSAVRDQSSTLTGDYLLDLRLAQYPQVTFWQKMSLTSGDAVGLDISLDDGLTWLPFDIQMGTVSDWLPRTLDLSAYRGQVIWLRFRLDTPGVASEGEGYWLDNLAVIEVLPTVPTLFPTASPSPTATPAEPPTVLPLPTAIPAPTEVPPIPTETPTEPPTALPLPTAIPAPTEVPPIPTETPTEPPTALPLPTVIPSTDRGSAYPY